MGQMGSFRVSGRSMTPNIHPGDWLLGERGAPYRFGDVVIIDRGDRWVAHRVIRVGRGSGWEMGDATPSASPFRTDQVIARVVTIVGALGSQRDLTSCSARARGWLWATRLLFRHLAGRLATLTRVLWRR